MTELSRLFAETIIKSDMQLFDERANEFLPCIKGLHGFSFTYNSPNRTFDTTINSTQEETPVRIDADTAMKMGAKGTVTHIEDYARAKHLHWIDDKSPVQTKEE